MTLTRSNEHLDVFEPVARTLEPKIRQVSSSSAELNGYRDFESDAIETDIERFQRTARLSPIRMTYVGRVPMTVKVFYRIYDDKPVLTFMYGCSPALPIIFDWPLYKNITLTVFNYINLQPFRWRTPSYKLVSCLDPVLYENKLLIVKLPVDNHDELVKCGRIKYRLTIH